ncbi:NACHT, LRR and PYD domains-containing protein 10 [Ochotona princeps]|uniref:NACHT, LRR and PYD domains-containing protein 10 n=1 Tax=Ochotona princeps TaxID=9978 RepID=UPI0027152BB9|nr:NACHT, LRR and PYD domains-containing protein 10 [Ochotona princeps]XP_058519417.1 NACHT, LRR and PYD domains-containing protein 10 [Ochotona princeps]
MAVVPNPQQALIWALNELEEKNFKLLKYHLQNKTPAKGHRQLTRGELEGLSQPDLASQLILIYGAQEAVKVVLEVLKEMHLMELVDQLNLVCLNDYREIYREHVRCLEERQEQGINSTYKQLLLVIKPSAESPKSPGCLSSEWELDSVQVEALFGSGEMPDPAPHVVVLQGSAGTGKTTLTKKMLLDWANGTLYQDWFDYVFYLSCREVGLLPGRKLDQLLFWCCGDQEAPITEILKQPERLLFILDGFDELQRPFRQSSPMENLLHLLIRRKVLPTCSLVITTRPSALRNLEPLLHRPSHVHVLGFSEEERREYFSSYFTNEEQARNAFEVVQGNDVLYKACQVPGICWMVCSWLRKKMERGQKVSEMLNNSTDIFTAYVSTFLSPDDNRGPALTRHRVLEGLCSLASEGIQCHRFLFEEADLRRHNLDGPRLGAFLSSNDYQEGRDMKKFYSFRHISFQEYFHAMSYLVKDNHNQLGKKSCREVEKLLEEKDKEMNLCMQFLWDISRKESFSNLELKFCFRIAPSIAQELKYFKQQMESMKHKRTWDLGFSLYETTVKNLARSVQMTDVSFKMEHSNTMRPRGKKSFCVKTSLLDGQREEQQCALMGQSNMVGAQKAISSGKDRETEEVDKEIGDSGMGSREMRMLKDLKLIEMEGQEEEGRRSEKHGVMRDQTNGHRGRNG